MHSVGHKLANLYKKLHMKSKKAHRKHKKKTICTNYFHFNMNSINYITDISSDIQLVQVAFNPILKLIR